MWMCRTAGRSTNSRQRIQRALRIGVATIGQAEPGRTGQENNREWSKREIGLSGRGGGGTGSGRTGPVRIGSGGAGLKINSRERRAEIRVIE